MDIAYDGQIKSAYFKDEMTAQSVYFDTPVSAKEFKFTIKDVYPTTKWEDTAISGIEFYLDGEEVEVDYSKFKDGLGAAKP